MEDTSKMTLEEKIEYYELLAREKRALIGLQSSDSELNRARSHSVGAAPGGCVELSLRGIDGKIIWTILQPVEVSELIHTLASAIGCYAALKPREDFTAWRNWTLSPEERQRLFMDPGSVHKLLQNGGVGLQNNDTGKMINNTESPGLNKQEE